MNYPCNTHSSAAMFPRQKSDSFEPCSALCIDMLHSFIDCSISSIDFIVNWMIMRIKVSMKMNRKLSLIMVKRHNEKSK